MARRNFSTAVLSFAEIPSSIAANATFNQIASAEDLAKYIALTALVALTRGEVKASLLDRRSLRAFFDAAPAARRCLQAFLDSEYAQCIAESQLIQVRTVRWIPRALQRGTGTPCSLRNVHLSVVRPAAG